MAVTPVVESAKPRRVYKANQQEQSIQVRNFGRLDRMRLGRAGAWEREYAIRSIRSVAESLRRRGHVLDSLMSLPFACAEIGAVKDGRGSLGSLVYLVVLDLPGGRALGKGL